MPAWKRLGVADVGRVIFPDRRWIVLPADLAGRAPQQLYGAGDSLACGEVFRVHREIDRRTSAIVLAHAAHRLGIAEATLVFFQCLFAEEREPLLALGQLVLDEEIRVR